MIEAQASERDKALLHAAHFARVEEVQALLAQGANPNRRMRLGLDRPRPQDDAGGEVTATLEAATTGNRECVLALVQAGGRLDLANERGYSALHRAILTGEEDFALWMAQLPQSVAVGRHIDGRELLRLACMYDMPKLLKAVLHLGYVKSGDAELLSEAANEAVLARNRACVQIVIDHAERDGCRDDLDLTKAFFQCGGDPKLEFMRWMLDHTNVATRLGDDAVDRMLSFDRPREARLLVEQGYFPMPSADVLALRIEDAVRNNHLGVVQLLTEWGVDRHPDVGVQALLKIAKREDMRRLLRAVQSQRVMEDAMPDSAQPSAGPRSDPGPI